MANIALITNNILTDSGTPLTSIPSGSGTTNYLSKWTSSSALGNSLVYDDGTNVGIGTTSPDARLHIYQNYSSLTKPLIVQNGNLGSVNYQPYDTAVLQQSDVTTLRLVEYNGGSTDQVMTFTIGDNYGRISTSAQPLQFFVNGSTSGTGWSGLGGTLSMTLALSGNVLIGTATDAGYKLDVNGTARVQGQLEVLSTSSAQGLLLKHTALSTTATQIYYNSSDAVTYLDTLFSYTASQPFGSVNIRTKDSLNALTSRLYVEGNSGNVGIGTTTFLGKFQVGSGSATQFQVASSGASIYVGPSSGNYNMNITTNTIQSSNSGTTNTYLYIQPNGSGNVAMCSSGTNKVLIGTTTDAGYKLDVNGTARINSTLALTSSTYAGTFSFYLSAANTLIGNSSNIGNWLQVGGGNRVYITGQEFNSTSRGNIFGNTVGGEAISATTIIAQSSGTTATTGLSLRYTINNTGTYVGISRGIYYNPTITSLTGTTHRAIETVTGDVIFGSTSGVVGIGTTSLSTEANLYLGAKSTIEGGQLVLQKGTSQTYATHLDNYNNQFRVMVGTDTGSTSAQLIVMHSTGNVLINTGTDNGYKLQVAGNTYVSGVTATSSLNVQNAAEVNSNESSNNLLVYADITGGSNKLYSGGQVKANIYTSSVTTPTVINTGTTVSLMEWYPTTTQGVMIDYVFYIASGNYMRSGTFTAVNDNAGNTQYVDNATPDLNGSTATVTFAAVDNGGTIEFQVTNASGSPVYMNILTRYIPNIF